MALTPMRKPEACPVVCKKLFISLHTSRRLVKNDTRAPSSYKPLILFSYTTLILFFPPTRILCDPHV